MPVLGMNQDTGSISEWLVEPGEAVKAGDPVMSVETDKAVQEIEARESGFMGRPLYPAGAEVEVGKVVGFIVSSLDEVESEAAPASPAEKSVPEQPDASSGIESPMADPVPEPPAAEVRPLSPVVAGKVLASPLAKKLAKERGISLAEVVEAGARPPLHSADIRGYEKVESHPNRVRSSSRLEVSADPTRLLSTLEQLSLVAESDLSKVLASLMAGARRFVSDDVGQQVIQIESGFTMMDPDKQGWGQITDCDDPMVTSRLMNFFGSRVTAVETGDPLPLSVVVTGGEQMHFEIRFDPERADLATMVSFATELAERVENPMRQLI